MTSRFGSFDSPKTSNWRLGKVQVSFAATIIRNGFGEIYRTQPAGSNSSEFCNDRNVTSLRHEGVCARADSMYLWLIAGGNAHNSSGSTENTGILPGSAPEKRATRSAAKRSFNL